MENQSKMQLVINGNRWFNKVEGNTYHSVQVFIDGNLIATQGKTYGYGNQYQQTARELLEKAGYDIFGYLRECFGSILVFCHDVQRQKDLNF